MLLQWSIGELVLKQHCIVFHCIFHYFDSKSPFLQTSSFSKRETIDFKLLISDSKIVLGVNVCECMSVSLYQPCDSLGGLSMVYPNSRPMGDQCWEGYF